MTNLQIYPDSVDTVDRLSYEPVSPKYRSVQIAGAVIAYVIIAALALLLLLADSPWWCVGAEAVTAVACVVNLTILRSAYRFKGYALRQLDITYRTGVIFPKTTTVPFSRIQQVSIRQTPVSKHFRLCAIDIVNGAQGLSSLTIQGLTEEKADMIKNVITRRLNDGND